MARKASCKLPNKPSELIRVALADLKKAERDNRYDITMENAWHESLGKEIDYDPDTCTVSTAEDSICAVCLAGAVMAFSLNAPPQISIVPSAYPKGIENKLMALESFRCGYVYDGLKEMGYSEKRAEALRNKLQIDDYWSIDVADYDASPEQFKRDMAKLARDLAKLGA